MTDLGDRRYPQYSRNAYYVEHTDDEEKKAKNGIMCWAEHSGPGRVICERDEDDEQQPIAMKYGGSIKKEYAVEPLYDPRLPFTMQIRDNDPHVLGRFNYTLCRQSSNRGLGNLVRQEDGGRLGIQISNTILRHPPHVADQTAYLCHHQAPGSVIVFVGLVKKATVLDTVFVVGEGVDVSV